MQVYCIESFLKEFNKLQKKKAYRNLESDIISYFFDKEPQDLLNGTRLNHSSDTPYIKKRLNGSGGYRFYFLVIIKNECLYLMFVHPKTGPDGAENITDESISFLYKTVLSCIQKKELYLMSHNEGKLFFSKEDN